MDHRARDIFRRIVESYLETGEPVGSRTLSKGGVSLSPASIRNTMQDLTQLGLWARRTSAPGGCRRTRGCGCSSTASWKWAT
jgi:transcriptional regulator of heat shock response